VTNGIGTPTSVYVGIDAGGSSAVVRAVANDEVVFAGTSGPANATSTPREDFERHLDEALRGCPTPTRVGGCFAGLGTPGARAVVAEYFHARFPESEVRLAPDYVAALLAGNGRFDVCCVAGTGSVCCSLAGDTLRVSGGRGHLIGDHGSAYRYGQALVSHALELAEADIPGNVADSLEAVFGTTDRREIVRAVHASDAPAPLLARLAPTLTESADRGEAWAQLLVRPEASAFAGTVAHHVRRFQPDMREVRLGLAGGVWASAAVREAFSSAVDRQLSDRRVATARLDVEPVDGAVSLAMLPGEVKWLG
jgi:N-acetylglucosamine kinase-like BadF-type ATPase